MRIVDVGVAGLVAYDAIDIGFQITSRLSVPHLVASRGQDIIEIPTETRFKNYDDCEEDRPTVLPTRWDTSRWAVFMAFEEDLPSGGTILARETPDLDLLEGRTDLAQMMDIRVAPAFRGEGVGKALFLHAKDWAASQSCIELRVETQDTNVAACRFYGAMGCHLHSADPHGYDDCDEAKLIWSIAL